MRVVVAYRAEAGEVLGEIADEESELVVRSALARIL